MLQPAKHFAKRWAWLKSRVAEFTRPPAPDILSQYVLKNQPLNHPVAIAHSDTLIRNIQARFPIVGVFAPPNLRPSIQLAPSCLRAPTSSARGLRPPTSCQFRSIVTNPSPFGHQTAQAASRCLTQNQYPAFARNFSTVKAPTLFQPVNAQTTIFANLSTKPFSAINQKGGYLLTQNPSSPEPVSLKVGRYNDDEPPRRSDLNQRNYGPNLVPAEHAATGLYAACSEPVGNNCSHSASKCAKRARLVRRGSKHVSFDRSSSAASICGTDLGSAESQDGKNNGRPRLVDGATPGARERKPPDRSRKEVYITLRLDAALQWDLSEIDDGTSSSLSPPSPFTSLTPPRQLSERTHLTSSLLAAFTDFADLHQRHLSSVLALLQTLSQHGSFTIEINGMHIRVCLDHLASEEAAREWLNSIGVDPHARYFGIEVIDVPETEMANLEDTIRAPVSAASNNQGPSAVLVTAALNLLPSHQIASSPSISSFSPDFSLVASSLESSAVLIQPTATELGPEYFRGIHEFLDVVNDMIQTGPAFTPLSKSDMSGSSSRLSFGKN